MTLLAGTYVGSYEVIGRLGAGGMGEVYRARDVKLARDVALKVLPEVFASDTHRAARFQREAQLLAAFSHPNIAAVFGLEQFGTSSVLVMEVVEGESLAERLTRGALAVDEAVAVATHIGDALAETRRNVDALPDGRLVGVTNNVSDDPATGDRIVVILNWLDDLKTRLQSH